VSDVDWLALEALVMRRANQKDAAAVPLDAAVERPEVVLRDSGADPLHMRRVLSELREAVLEQVGTDQTDRLRQALADALNTLSA
jgi:hypothetical protein